METPQISPYDNQISILYKAGEYFQTPTRYIAIRDKQANDTNSETMMVVEDLVYQPLLDLLSDNPEMSLGEAYDTLIDEESQITRQDFALLYTYYLITNAFPETTETNQLQLLQDAINQGVITQGTIQDIHDFIQSDIIQTIPNLRVYYEDFISRWIKELQEDALALDRILDIQDDLEGIPQELLPSATPLYVDRVTLRSYPTWDDGRAITPEDGLDIFNTALASYFTPYIQYNTGTGTNIDKSYYKIYRGETTTTDVGLPGAEPNLSMIIPDTKTKAMNKANLIYATIWSGETGQVITRPTREGYTKLLYDLDTGVMTFKTRISQKNPEAKALLIERVTQIFPTLALGEITEVRISGEFDLFLGEEIKDYVLLNEILNNRTFTAYLYIDERQKAYPEKKRITVHYRSILGEAVEETTSGNNTQTPASVSAVIGQRYVTDDEATPEVPTGTPYLKINITKGASRRVAEQFRKILILLMGLYLQNEEAIVETYTGYIPPLETEEEEEVKPRRRVVVKKGTTKRRIYQLEDAAPHIFVPGYARKCQSKLQPIAIQAADVSAWKAKQVRNPDTGLFEDRQVLAFPPPPNDEILLVCPSDIAPYPSIKTNHEENKDRYPYIPCCAKTDHTIPGKKTKYNAYYRGLNIEGGDGKKRMNIITDKILSPGGLAEIPLPLERILLYYNSEATQFKRYGVVRDTNSFLHCVLDALDHENYRALSVEEKIAMAREIRMALPEKINMAVMKQEFYDFTLEQIEEQVLTEELFFDPALYYRAVEEYFDINIYTFIPGKRPKKDRGEVVGKIEVPRHKFFHSRPLRLGRNTILIFKHWGAEADALDYPQCELLVDYTKETRAMYRVFGDDMTQVIQGILNTTFPTTTWSYHEGSLQTHTNLYSKVNFDTLTERRATAQIIDDYGKLRGLVLGDEMTLFFIPSQPENLPIATTSPNLVSAELPISLFGEPTAKGLDGKGLWFSRPEIPNYPYVIYTPVESIQAYETLPVGPIAPIEIGDDKQSVVERTLLLTRQISLLLQVIRWLFLLSEGTVDEFMSQYTMTWPDPVEDSATFYDLSSLPRRLPETRDVATAIGILEPLVPTLFRRGRLVLYNSGFAEKIRGNLQLFSRELPERIPRFLEGYYLYESDFKPQERTIILIGEQNLETWLLSLARSGYQGITILKQLDIAFMDRVEPYLYLSEVGVVYLIQNVEGGNLDRALGVSLNWYFETSNLGYTASPVEDTSTLPYRVYEISPSSALRLTKEYVDPNTPPEEVLEVLEYSEGNYAALLPLSLV
jgi:hypothetical protein